MQAGESATACDLVGKRWALQVVRELALGPWRFTDLHHSLQGISTNVLAARLRELQHANVVRRRLLPPPASSMVYELTDGGRELEWRGKLGLVFGCTTVIDTHWSVENALGNRFLLSRLGPSRPESQH